jgi:hypothetical protein
MVADGDRAPGPGHIAATGQRVRIAARYVRRVQGGRIAHTAVVVDPADVSSAPRCDVFAAEGRAACDDSRRDAPALPGT